ncbi:uncharacterized protein K460DRAFT_367108 [Cucurbitaria berberidis CBS 394.84]|uniref:Uncharacterized protein n=1 Tax=Cucurbitaria berberidis CBS 394.84 TaxID=1168544 RepID=A0A9P4GJ11_9PLEO|nr:uncharacterized protein K460DRAFT_367108 [Cucurbitaria berberidis CBS 394.84]KAF1846301.1 hypothetical protein K460DRAFT_367108 [Cucurbitaria berberidis CBS 394.84]
MRICKSTLAAVMTGYFLGLLIVLNHAVHCTALSSSVCSNTIKCIAEADLMQESHIV